MVPNNPMLNSRIIEPYEVNVVAGLHVLSNLYFMEYLGVKSLFVMCYLDT